MRNFIFKCSFFFACLFHFNLSIAQVSIIPEPQSIIKKSGYFLLNDKTKILFNNPGLKTIVLQTIPAVNKLTRFSISSGPLDGGNILAETIRLKVDSALNLPDEAYTLTITPSNITINASHTAGILYGLQTWLQLIPADGEKQIPCLFIEDKPRFAWRGLLLDVSRHFFQISDIKKLLDEMVLYKFNRLHLHLSDDQGWRIEIKSYPELTDIGAWRVPRMGLWWHREPPAKDEKASYGGFYTKEQLKELVSYARDRHIEIVPEIDVPGHSLAAIASYSWLSCTKQQYFVNPGSEFYTKEDNALCAGQEATFAFLDKVFTELAEIFPYEYIHIGGDECYKGFWEKCDSCRRRMSENHLANTEQLQSYFIKRVEKILASKGKRLMGWDEILEGGLAPNASVMSWRGMEGGIQATKEKHQVVMSPSSYAYLDLYQGDPAIEPPTYSMLRLKTVYSFEPIPAGIDPVYVLGVQGNLWSESVPTFRHAEYMFWPRAMALSEIAWSLPEKKNWESFVSRSEQQFKRFDKGEINYSRSMYDAIITPSLNDQKKLQIELSTEIGSIDLYYTFDDTYPDKYTLKYHSGEKLQIPKDADMFRVITYKGGKPIGRMISVHLEELGKRISD